MHFVLNPCPTCGEQFDFPVTGCMTFVGDLLTASTGGKCPKCGTQVVVDEPQEQGHRVDSLSLAQSEEEIRAVKIVDLDLSVRCRNALVQMGLETVGDMLELTKTDLANRLGHIQLCIKEIDDLLAGKGLKQRER
jgi:DNA-directed RNA polymerase alpha subunit